jgi:trimeric autotransporter adhesin
MKVHHFVVFVISLLALAVSSFAQDYAGSIEATPNVVPHLIIFSGTAKDETGKPISGVVGVTFALYKDEQGGSALWLETQNVQADASGRYTVMLGSASANGIPLDIFSSAEAHWLSTRVSGQSESARVLLLSVPYALKAADAETLGGMPASAFVQAAPAEATATTVTSKGNSNKPNSATNSFSPALAGSGTTDFLPLWTSGTELGNSILYQTGGNVGVNTKTPGATLDTAGTAIALRGSSSGKSGTGVFGKATSTDSASTSINFGVQGTTASVVNGSAGVAGSASSTSGKAVGILGTSTSPHGPGIMGTNSAASGIAILGEATALTTTAPGNVGVQGHASGALGTGVVGVGPQIGVSGTSQNGNLTGGIPTGVYGNATGTTSTTYGVEGVSASPTGVGVAGFNSAVTGSANGIFGQTASAGGAGGLFQNTSAATGAQILAAEDGSGNQRFSVDTQGNVRVITGTTTKVEGPLIPVNHARAVVDILLNEPYFVTLNWSFPFPDTSYTVSCSPLVPSSFQGEGSGVYLLQVTSIATSTAQVEVAAEGGTGDITIHCIGVHD